MCSILFERFGTTSSLFSLLLACGYARSDGVVVMYIQRACEAKRIYASVLHSSTIFNGAREGTLLELDLKGMTDFINNFYKQSGVDPAEVEYVETYGCGIKVSVH